MGTPAASAVCNFDPPAEDALGVLSSTAPVLRGARHLRLDADAALRFARAHAGQAPPAPAEDTLHCAFLAPRARLNWLLALEALNFCFWDAAPRWRVDYRGAKHDGYWALAAALHRAVAVDAAPVWDAAWLAGLTAERVAHLLRGEGRPAPLLPERLANLREAGAVLLARWDGQFANVVAAAGGDAIALVRLIVAEFPSFRDEAAWQGQPVRFHKRAQICVADLARLLADDPLGRLRNLHCLTAFADYKVPQVLRKEGVLLLGEALAARVDAEQELPAGSEEEVELRAATIWGCEWIARASAAAGTPLTAADVDYHLWLAGQDNTGLRPYHRTRTVYY